ncbi:Crp/Fnr family transcriptional regulator [Nitrococcus mobilis]|uniref:Possible regulator protein n=1 Tax=Nitrococcus mobilis Nb-231 TaxID=314278 RepID=A4BQ09_9GAMM|nr:Crp/Fnr family transcriptional regulator [Nitrococcus mobilis]EAR22164.1 possible regulator protein [Nitrococcus mobilis Nb-231]
MAKDSISEYLANQSFFADLSPAFRKFLARHAVRRPLQRDEILFQHGDPARRFYLVYDGSVVIEVPAIYGPSLEVQKLGPGQILGWSWLIPPYRWHFQARTEAPTEVIEFDGEAVRARCDQHPAFGYALLKCFSALMSERLQAARRKMMEEWNPPGFA